MTNQTAGQRGRNILAAYVANEPGTDGSMQNALVWLLTDLLHTAKAEGWDFPAALDCAREAMDEENLSTEADAADTPTVEVWMGGPPEAVCQDCYQWGPLPFLPKDMTEDEIAVGKAADGSIVTVLAMTVSPDGTLVCKPVEPGVYPYPGTHPAAVMTP